MPAEATASTTWAIIGRPATGCSTFDFEDFIRVLSPAARMTARQVRSMICSANPRHEAALSPHTAKFPKSESI
ncbi:hypothetical protein ACOJBM_14775 [Rhizobium beringeri]